MGQKRQLRRKAIREDHKRQKEYLAGKTPEEKTMILTISAELNTIAMLEKRTDKEEIFTEGQKYVEEEMKDERFEVPARFRNLVDLMKIIKE